MIHFISSEALAAMMCLVLFLTVTIAYFFQFQWWCNTTEVDMLITIVSCIFICRGVASGQRCKWPHGVDFSSRVALVTGASSGVGFGIAQELALHGWTVIIAGRDVKRLLKARQSIIACRKSKGRLVVLGPMDLSDLDSVRQFAANVLENKEKLPVSLLVNAAGVLRRHLHRCEDTGIEEMIATNVLGPMLFTELLLPLLNDTAERSGVASRVVNVASSCHTFLGIRRWRERHRLQDPIEMLAALHPRGEKLRHVRKEEGTECKKDWDCTSESTAVLKDFSIGDFVGYYGLSKLCVVWWTTVLARRSMLRFSSGEKEGQRLKVLVSCCHPGVTLTHLYRDLLPVWALDCILYYPSLLIGKTWTEAAQAALKACIEPEHVAHGGYYLCSGEQGPRSGINCLSKHAMNIHAAQQFCMWAEEQIEAQKNLPKKKKLDAPVPSLPRRIMTVKIK